MRSCQLNAGALQITQARGNSDSDQWLMIFDLESWILVLDSWSLICVLSIELLSRGSLIFSIGCSCILYCELEKKNGSCIYFSWPWEWLCNFKSGFVKSTGGSGSGGNARRKGQYNCVLGQETTSFDPYTRSEKTLLIAKVWMKN